ncbi:Zinc transporter ZIP9-A [Acromyrmex echinatior]|uniref:Zinc transporter ZIP9-A n=1 Tax=Acromyrmex echinatior TaxID=103372 RepID=F4WUF8_ACREC|nr:Zinc transporter ZIP9-A [Acromyrmex echinatior]
MEKGAMLWILTLVMLVGSCLAGSLPLVMTLSEDKLQLVSVLGAGLLVGTALAVIIPEGIRALFTGEITNEKQLHGDLHSLIGISLVLGFVFMLLIDQCSAKKSDGRQKSVTATLGLVVHAAVDGVALGAAATTSQTDVEMIVFLAIMLHKAPAAFGLVSFLLHEGVDKKRISRHLLIFSLAAPCLTLVTYFGIGKTKFLQRRGKCLRISSVRRNETENYVRLAPTKTLTGVLYLDLCARASWARVQHSSRTSSGLPAATLIETTNEEERTSLPRLDPIRCYEEEQSRLPTQGRPSRPASVTQITLRMGMHRSKHFLATEAAGREGRALSSPSRGRRIHEIIGGCETPCLLALKEGKETLNNVNATGLAMLFSAGTFLYVATVHVLPELMTRSSNYSHVPSVEGTTLSATGLKVKEILFLVIGIFLPALITTGHHH